MSWKKEKNKAEDMLERSNWVEVEWFVKWSLTSNVINYTLKGSLKH